MLTLSYVFKNARLLEQTGEPRPGFLVDGTAELKGQQATVELRALSDASNAAASNDQSDLRVRVRFEYAEDQATGKICLIQKR